MSHGTVHCRRAEDQVQPTLTHESGSGSQQRHLLQHQHEGVAYQTASDPLDVMIEQEHQYPPAARVRAQPVIHHASPGLADLQDAEARTGSVATGRDTPPARTAPAVVRYVFVYALRATFSLLVWLLRTIMLSLCFCSPWAPPLAVWAVVCGLDPALVWNNAQQQDKKPHLAESKKLSLVITFGVLGSASLLAGNCLAQHHPWEGPISTAFYPDHPNTRPRKTVFRIYTWSCFSLATTFFAATIAILARSKNQLPAYPDPLTPESATTAEQTASVDPISQIQALEATIARLSEPSALFILLYAFGCTTFGALWADFINPRLRTLESTLAAFSLFWSRAEAASVSTALALPRSLVSKLHHWREPSAHASDLLEIARLEKYTGHVSYHHERVELFKEESEQSQLADNHRESYELERPTARGEQTESWMEEYRPVYSEEDKDSQAYEGYRIKLPMSVDDQKPQEQEQRHLSIDQKAENQSHGFKHTQSTSRTSIRDHVEQEDVQLSAKHRESFELASPCARLAGSGKQRPGSLVDYTKLPLSLPTLAIGPNKQRQTQASEVGKEQMQIDFLYDILQLATTASVELIDMQPELAWYMRPYLIDFLIEIHWQFRLQPETLYLAVNIVDRYTSKRIVYKRHYQLVGCAALCLAAKFGDDKDRAPTIQNLCLVTCNVYDASAFSQMEAHILCTLNWLTGHRTAEAWLRDASIADGTLLTTDTKLQHVARLLMELTLFHRAFVPLKSSDIARGCLMLARFLCGKARVPADETMIAVQIAQLLDSYLAEHMEYVSTIVIEKYSTACFSKAAKHVREWYLAGHRFNINSWPTLPATAFVASMAAATLNRLFHPPSDAVLKKRIEVNLANLHDHDERAFRLVDLMSDKLNDPVVSS